MTTVSSQNNNIAKGRGQRAEGRGQEAEGKRLTGKGFRIWCCPKRTTLSHNNKKSDNVVKWQAIKMEI
ncbi:MAG: hypothetical protein F6J86_44455 [Symploca sp. SIO1B1]|nr:hypothetical protein [Symploca sp. SIO1B1]